MGQPRLAVKDDLLLVQTLDEREHGDDAFSEARDYVERIISDGCVLISSDSQAYAVLVRGGAAVTAFGGSALGCLELAAYLFTFNKGAKMDVFILPSRRAANGAVALAAVGFKCADRKHADWVVVYRRCLQVD